MTRAPNWSKGEFAIVLTSYRLSNEELQQDIPNRSVGAIDIVREGIHAFHQGMNVSMLSNIMIDFLERRRGSLKCPKCGNDF
jgi:hypothetical protein